mmetsp:Transcript_1924/g.1840  ORF Transcript_1924/g.1840 Transcript_1924/m.1840 type:complete len:107 (+) Transcript_1924:72-392(+)
MQQQEEYKDIGEYKAEIEMNEPKKKVEPVAGYGQRVRIAKLHERHEDFLYRVIKVAGWARSTRSVGKDFMFITLSDGSSQKDLQIVVDKCLENFEEITKTNVGTSF